MAHRQYLIVSGLLFCLVALAHLLRAVYSMPVVVDEYVVPMYLSWIAVVITAGLAFWALRLARTEPRRD